MTPSIFIAAIETTSAQISLQVVTVECAGARVAGRSTWRIGCDDAPLHEERMRARPTSPFRIARTGRFTGA